MKKLLLLISAVLISSSGFAAPLSSSLGSAWKSYHTIHPKQDKNDVEIVYGGQDVSAKSLTQQTAIA